MLTVLNQILDVWMKLLVTTTPMHCARENVIMIAMVALILKLAITIQTPHYLIIIAHTPTWDVVVDFQLQNQGMIVTEIA